MPPTPEQLTVAAVDPATPAAGTMARAEVARARAAHPRPPDGTAEGDALDPAELLLIARARLATDKRRTELALEPGTLPPPPAP